MQRKAIVDLLKSKPGYKYSKHADDIEALCVYAVFMQDMLYSAFETLSRTNTDQNITQRIKEILLQDGVISAKTSQVKPAEQDDGID